MSSIRTTINQHLDVEVPEEYKAVVEAVTVALEERERDIREQLVLAADTAGLDTEVVSNTFNGVGLSVTTDQAASV